MRKPAAIAFSTIIVVVLLIPSIGMLWARSDTTTENKALATFPSPTLEDGSWNSGYLEEAGNWFCDHFAYREQMVTANALIRAKAFSTSATDQVIVGDDDWLYFSGSTDDYLGTHRLSERGIYNAAYSLSLADDYVTAQGSRLIVTIAPNKNTLYPEHMPSRYPAAEEHDAQAFGNSLERMGVTYVDLFDTLGAHLDENLYFERDTHWNNLGAAYAYTAIMDASGREYTDFSALPYSTVPEHEGDLDLILYPLATTPETEYRFKHADSYTFEEGSSSEDATVETSNAGGTGTLLAYRDSFGNALLPFFADDFEHVYYSKLTPYDLGKVAKYHPDIVIMERAERHLSNFAAEPAIFDAPERNITWAGDIESTTSLDATTDGPYYEFSGSIEPALLQLDSKIYLAFADSQGKTVSTREACPMTVQDDEGTLDDGCYIARIDQDALPEGTVTISVLISSGDDIYRVSKEDVDLAAL